MKMLIADDHAVLRKGLIQILAEGFPGTQFGETSSTPETLEHLSQQKWDALVLDVFMPGRSGLEVLHEVRKHHPHLPVLVLSSAPEEQLAVRVLSAGASGYLNKQVAAEELVRALRKILSGGKYISPLLADQLGTEVGRSHDAKEAALSDREYAVLQSLMAGKSITEIGNELCLSPKTISVYHTRIWQKLGVHNDIEMVNCAVERELVVRK